MFFRFLIAGRLKTVVHSSVKLLLLISLVVFFSQNPVFSENARFRTQLDTWIIPADSSFSNALTVTVQDSDTGEPVSNLQIGVLVQKDGSLLSSSPNGSGEKEVYIDTDKSGQAVVYYRFDPTRSTEGLRLPFQEKIAVFCSDFSYEKTLFLSVGIDMAPASGGPRIPPQWYPLEKVPLQLTVKDLSHPNSDINMCRKMLADSTLELEVIDSGMEESSPDWESFRKVMGPSVDSLVDKAKTAPSVVFVNCKNLRLLPTGSAEHLLYTSSGAPSLIFKKSGTYNLTIFLKGVKGDSDDKNNLLPVVVPLAAHEPTPFDDALNVFSQIIALENDCDEYGVYHPLNEGDLIGFGLKCNDLISGIARKIIGHSSNSSVNAETVKKLLSGYLLATSLQSFSQSSLAERKAFFRHIRLSAPVETHGMPLSDWIDSVVYGFLVNDTKRSLVFFECSEDFPAEDVKVVAGGRTYRPSMTSSTLKSNETLVHIQGRYGVLCYENGTGTESVEAHIPKEVRGIAHYSLDKGVLLILRSALTLDSDSVISFVPGIKGKGLISVTSSTGKKEVTGLVAASSINFPTVKNDLAIDRKAFKIVPSRVEFPVESRGKLAKEDFSLYLDDTELSFNILSNGVIQGTLPNETGVGVHAVVLNMKDATNISEQRKVSFVVHKDEPLAPAKPEWELRSRTGKSRKVVRESTPRPTVAAKHTVTQLKEPTKPTRDPETVKIQDPVSMPDNTVPDHISGRNSSSGTGYSAQDSENAGNSHGGTQNHTSSDLDSANAGETVGIEDISDAQLYGGTPPADSGHRNTSIRVNTYGDVDHGQGTGSSGTPTPTPVSFQEISVSSGASLELNEVSVCTAIENNIALGIGTRFLQGTEKLFCWYKFDNRGSEKTEVTTEWYYFSQSQGKYVLSLRKARLLPSGSGSAYSTISRGGGKPLPDGRYRVEVKSAGKIIDVIPFSVGSN